ncbi:MAG: class I SAM-dependent methyltransferase [Gemmataceae bacterium]|nr:class I SAM-dependent methyltransferase [Gemmataceae bacterium]
MKDEDAAFVPGAGFHWLTPLYDPLVALTCRDRAVKRSLVAAAAVRPGQRVLDLGCGTGTLALRVKEACPSADVSGLDADPRMLRAAAAKADRQGRNVAFARGLAQSLPYPDGGFDRVVSGLFFHHLAPDAKAAAFREAFRVLVSGGELHLADWGRPAGPLMRVLFLGIRLLDGFGNTAAHAAGRLPGLVAEAGFVGVRVRDRFSTVFGTLEVVSAVKPTGTQPSDPSLVSPAP